MRLRGRRGLLDRRGMRAYQAQRGTPHRDSVCNAPLTNLYLKVDGVAAPCWLYFPARPPRWSTKRSIRDIWTGPEFEKARRAHRQGRFLGRCQACEYDIAGGNRPLAAAYDNDRPIGEWPTMLELELSNLCNLECVMCSGTLSSKIRKNRDHLPPLISPYDETFVDQVTELLPHLDEIRFNGGEPLLQPIVHQIADRIGDLRPDLKVTIATNGTVINTKVRRLLERCNVHVNLSIDSLQADRYEAIRVGADFDEVMANFMTFRGYCHDRDRTLCVMVNPMRANWDEMAHYVWWANEQDVHLWFNTIRYPTHVALHNLPHDQLAAIHDTLAAEPLPQPAAGEAGDVHRYNIEVFERFVRQVATWRDEAGVERDPSNAVPVELRRRPSAEPA